MRTCNTMDYGTIPTAANCYCKAMIIMLRCNEIKLDPQRSTPRLVWKSARFARQGNYRLFHKNWITLKHRLNFNFV